MKLPRTLCFIDLETTGTDPSKDRIIDIGICARSDIFSFPLQAEDGHRSEISWRINLGVSIPPEATACHRISDADVKGCPLFKDVAPQIHRALSGHDLAGFSLMQFDIPLLWEEFYRAGISWNLDGVRIIDVKNIFFKKEPRTLSAAMQFYCGEEHVEAHGALADAKATAQVLWAQLDRYEDLRGLDVEQLANFCQMEENPRIDLAGKLVRDKEGDAVYTFGPKKGFKLKDDIGFARWMLSKDFSRNTKIAVERELSKIER